MIGCGDDSGVLSRLDLLYLHSMTQREPVYHRYVVADYLHHQSQYLLIGALFAGPYISRVLFKIGFLLSMRREEKISTPAPLGLVTLRLMGIVRYIGSSRYTLVESSSDDELIEAPNAPPEGKPMVIEAAPVLSSDLGPSSTQVHEHQGRFPDCHAHHPQELGMNFRASSSHAADIRRGCHF